MPNTPPPRPPEPSTWDQIHTWTAHHIDFGDVPTWLAFGGAGIAAYYALRALRVEQDRDRERHDEARRAQATMVSVWPDIARQDREDSVFSPRWFEIIRVRVLNLSEQPVTHVRVVMVLADAEHLVDEFRTLPPGERLLSLDHDLYTKVGDWFTDPDRADHFLPDWQDGYRDLPVHVEFTDAAGVRWLRDDDGLREIDTPPHLVRKPLPPDPQT